MSLSAQRVDCPNQDYDIISVEYLILHYTAADLSNTLAVFQDRACSVSSHLVIDSDGTVYSLVDCLEGYACRAWHAGQSEYLEGDYRWSGFNDFSIGIELVNYNGNLFPFTDAQYESLGAVVLVLKKQYPALSDPARVLGHEQIAGYRGKVDPGICFDWTQFWQRCYPDAVAPKRDAACPDRLLESVRQLVPFAPSDLDAKAQYWMRLSSLMENAVQLLHNHRTND